MKTYWKAYWAYFKNAARLPLTLTPKYFDWPAFWRDMREAGTSLAAVLFLIVANLLYPVSVLVAPVVAIESDRRTARKRKAAFEKRARAMNGGEE
jgi:hypothetical protein